MYADSRIKSTSCSSQLAVAVQEVAPCTASQRQKGVPGRLPRWWPHAQGSTAGFCHLAAGAWQAQLPPAWLEPPAAAHCPCPGSQLRKPLIASLKSLCHELLHQAASCCQSILSAQSPHLIQQIAAHNQVVAQVCIHICRAVRLILWSMLLRWSLEGWQRRGPIQPAHMHRALQTGTIHHWHIPMLQCSSGRGPA